MTPKSMSDRRAAVRLRSFIGLVAAALVCIGCAAPGAEGSQDASVTPAASSRASAIPTPTVTVSPTAEPSVTAAPSLGPSAGTPFEFNDILRVEVNGLAVRVSPDISSSLAQGVERPGDVRLDAGDYVSVELGPLPVGDVVWYLVWPAEDARLHYSTVSWNTDGDDPVGGVDPGWVAASVGDDQYLSLYRSTDPSEYESWPAGGPRTLMDSGTGDYVSESLAQHDLFDFDWAAAVHDQPAPCSFSVTLLPEGGAEPVVVIETSVADVEQGPVSGSAGIVDVPWPASAGEMEGPSFTVSVRSGCAWSLKLAPLPHD